MADTFQFSLISLEGRIFEGQVKAITVPGSQGRFGVLVGHAQLVSSLVGGQLDVTTKDGVKHYIVSGGVCEVRQDETVVLAPKAQAVSGPQEVKELLAASYATR